MTVDDTTNSVYITRNFIGYSGKTSNGGSCNGDLLVVMRQGCNNINTISAGKRVKCVRYVN